MKLLKIKSKGKSVADLNIVYQGGNFYCVHNQLTSLFGAPSSIGGDFYCGNNKLKSLVGAPTSVGGDFNCNYNKLTSLVGAPSSIGGDFYCSDNELTSLVGAPSFVGDDFYCSNNKLTSLANIHRQISHIKGLFYAFDNPIKSHVLGLLLIEGVTDVVLDISRVQDILNTHLPSRGMRDVLEAQDELIEAGLEEFAQL